MKTPRTLRVLLAPSATFREALAEGKGLGTLFLLLGIELAITSPVSVATAIIRLPANPLAAVGTLWSQLLHYALPPLVGMLVLAVLLYYELRLRHRRSVDLWSVASMLAYAWVPHVLLVATGVLLARLGTNVPFLPSGDATSLTPTMQVLRLVVSFGPSVALGAVAVRAMRTSAGALERLPTRAQLAIIGSGALVLITLAGAMSAQATARNWEQVRPVMAGDALPPMTLHGLGGAALPLATLRGRVALVDFWATWCPPCVASMPHLQQLRRELASEGFELVSVNVEPDNVGAVQRFSREHALDFPIYVDSGALQARLQVTTLPTAVIVDRRGQVRQVYIGMTSEGALRRQIRALLDEGTSPESPSGS
ncbi:MAG: TlpA disulfide reductase family protein [Myxococcota bacterium]